MNKDRYLIEAEDLEPLLNDGGHLIIDLSKPETYARLHIPGAIPIDYASLVDGNKPAPGLLPSEDRLASLAAQLRLTENPKIVAYDDEGGGRAARLTWTLHYLGHQNVKVLNGGLHAWSNEGHPVTEAPSSLAASSAVAVSAKDASVLADSAYILEHLDDPDVQILDARSPEEYRGEKVFAARGGHIPGAINLNWQETLDTDQNLRLKPRDVLMGMLEARGIRAECEVITYCQTHHRSAHAWWMLKTLGFERVRGYAGSWSEWGNTPTLPIE